MAAEAERQGKEQGQQAVVRRRAVPFNLAELMAGGDVGQGGSVVDDILVVSEDEGEEARRMAVEGGPGQPAAPEASGCHEVHPLRNGRGRRRARVVQPAAGAAESRDSSVRTGGQGRTGKGGKGQAGASGARHATGHQEGKRGKRGWTGATVAAAPTLVQAAAARVAPTGQCGGACGGGEGAGSAVRRAGAHGMPAPSPPAPGAGTRHHLPAGDGIRKARVRAPGWTGGVGTGAQRTTQWRAAERGRASITEQRSGGGAPRPAGGRAREWEPATCTGRQHGAGQGCGTRRR